MAAGRPGKYEIEVKPKLRFIRSLVRDGYTDTDIQEFLNVSVDAFYRYKKDHKEFSECFEKEDIIDQVEKTFINRLTGKYKAEKEIYERDKDTGEMVLVRKERMRPEKWAINSEAQKTLEMIKGGIKLNIVNGGADE
jgi:ribosome-binding ATPase YchF (GTP1/OBG family)